MYLRQRAGVWYFRRRVPSDLEGIIEPSRFHYSLATKSRKEALKPYAAALAQSEQEISEAREKIQTAAAKGQSEVYPLFKARRLAKASKAKRKRSRAFCQYSEGDILFLVSRWFEKEKRETDMIYRGVHTMTDNEEDREPVLKDLGKEKRPLIGDTPEMKEIILSREVRSILDAEDCEPPREWLDDPLFRRFYGLVAEGLIHLNRIAVSLVKTGEMPERFPGLAAFAPFISQSSPVVGAGAICSAGQSITLDELISRFKEEPRRQSLRESTRKEYGLTYRALREQIGGSKPVAEITRDEIRAVADMFLHLPARATLTNHTEPLQDISARAKADGKPQANVKTFNKKVHQITAIFGYAEVEQLIPSSPAQRLALPEPPANGDEKGYTDEQLQVIFSGSLFRQFIEVSPVGQSVPAMVEMKGFKVYHL